MMAVTTVTQATFSAACPPPPDRLSLPSGWCAQVFADGLGAARHLAIGPEGTVYVMTDGPARTFAASFPAVDGRGPIIALQDLNGDGQADAGFRFGEAGGTGLALIDNTLFVGEDRRILRYPLDRQSGRPIGPPVILVSGFPDQRQHAAKSIALDNRGSRLFVNVGAPSNACQRTDRRPGSPGRDPCPERDVQAGIWRYDATRTGQRHPADGTAQARGVRHAVALAWRKTDEMLYAVQHGRDQLSGLWPDRYDAKVNAENPAEELLRLTPGSDFGWPYCYFDLAAGRRVLAPEYGGDGKRVGRCAEYSRPVLALPAHTAPNALVFDDDERLPPPYRGGALIALHGSWNRAPLPQAGYAIEFVSITPNGTAASSRPFVRGFAGHDPIRDPGAARYRPSGLTIGPDGAVYVSDSRQGRIWRLWAPEAMSR
ncbi:MAG: PQQ-dependent sugar dehydrogenase [Pseudomonadota bacterium]